VGSFKLSVEEFRRLLINQTPTNTATTTIVTIATIIGNDRNGACGERITVGYRVCPATHVIVAFWASYPALVI
jgi:hypothetical protein